MSLRGAPGAPKEIFPSSREIYRPPGLLGVDGRVGTPELRQRNEADPVEPFSAREREQLERFLASL